MMDFVQAFHVARKPDDAKVAVLSQERSAKQDEPAQSGQLKHGGRGRPKILRYVQRPKQEQRGQHDQHHTYGRGRQQERARY